MILGNKVCAGISLSFTLFFLWLWYEQYARWKDCFNTEGRCFREEGLVYLEQSGIVWGGCSAFSFIFFLLFCFMARVGK